MRGALLVTALAAALVAPPQADAAVATLAYEAPLPGIEPNPAYTLSVRAGGAAGNLLTVGHDGSAYTVNDRSGPLAAGPGCSSVTANLVRCPAAQAGASHSVFVDAGDGADYVGIESVPANAAVEVRGARGADYVVGSPGADELSGGRGPDHVNGRGGDDTIEAGSGDDLIDGGDGRDRLSYEMRRSSLQVDLRAGSAGSRTEHDRFIGIEDAVGGRAPDVLAGDSGPNRLLGGGGTARDRLFGRGGDDALVGYRVSGGTGDDSIDARIAGCGGGRDQVRRVAFTPRGPFSRGCEGIVAGTFLELAPDPVLLTRRVAVYRLHCVAATGRCAGTLELRDPDGLVGRAAFERRDAGAAEPTRLRIPLRRPIAARVGTVRLRAQPAYRRDRFRTRLR